MKTWPEFPPLESNNRGREFNDYTEEQRSIVVYHWLKGGMSTRQMDRDLLKIGFVSEGRQSNGICRYLGLTDRHKGFFKGWLESDVIAYFHRKIFENPDLCIIFYYYLDYMESREPQISKEDLDLIDEARLYHPEDDLKVQTWIRNTWVKKKEGIDERLLALPDIESGNTGRVLISNEHYAWYSNTTVKETIKDLYDFTCQVCGQTILKTGWNNQLSRVDSWRYMSADVHHILPLSQGGPDRKDNMLCLCPTCHRKFHSGQFRLKEQNNHISLVDELLGSRQDLVSRHRVVLY